MGMLPCLQVRQVQVEMLRVEWAGLVFELFKREKSRMQAVIWDILGTLDNRVK